MMTSKPTVLPKPTTMKPNSNGSTTEAKPTVSTTEPKPTVLPKPTTQTNSTGSDTKPVLPSSSTVTQIKPILFTNSMLLTKPTDYGKIIGDAFIEMPRVHATIAEINREFLLKIQTPQQKEVQIHEPTAQPNSTGSAPKLAAQSNATGYTTKLDAQSNSTGSTTKPIIQSISSGSITTPIVQSHSISSITKLAVQSNYTGPTTTPTTQSHSSGSITKSTAQPNSTGSTPKFTIQSNSTGSTPKLTVQSNSTSATPKLTTQPNSTGSTAKLTTQPKSTGSTPKLTTQLNSTGSTVKPTLTSYSTVTQIKLPLSTNPEDFLTPSTSPKTIVGDAFIEMPIVHSAIAELNPEFRWKIQALQSKEIQIHTEIDQSTVTLRGNRKVVYEAKQHILELLAEDKLVRKNIDHVKNTKGIKDYLLLLSQTDLGLPSYWTNSTCPDPSTPKFNCCLLARGSPVHEAVTALILNTWNTSSVGAGQNSKGLLYSKLVIKGVWIIENPLLYANYQYRLKALAFKAAHKPFTKVSEMSGEPNVKTREIAGADYLNSRLISELNEVYLFHGTQNVQEIAQNGIDCRLAGDRTLFGRGAYFAESSTKSDQYADRRRLRKDESLFMFVARVLLGEPFIAREARPDLRKAPCSNQDFKKDDFLAYHPSCDSVIGTHMNSSTPLLFREFIVYHPEQCYPEFLVEYARE